MVEISILFIVGFLGGVFIGLIDIWRNLTNVFKKYEVE